MVSENEAAQQRADELTRALMRLHPDYAKRAELEAANVTTPRINALYPLDIDFFITCVIAYLDASGAFHLLVTGGPEAETRADRLDFAAWSTFDQADRDETMKRWGNAADQKLEATLIERLKDADPGHNLNEKKYFDACVNTMRLLSRLFWYQTNLSLSTNPYRVHNALSRIYHMAMPDLGEVA